MTIFLKIIVLAVSLNLRKINKHQISKSPETVDFDSSAKLSKSYKIKDKNHNGRIMISYKDFNNLEKIFTYVSPKQVHVFNFSNSNITNYYADVIFKKLDIFYFKHNIPVNVMLNTNRITDIAFLNKYIIPTRSLIHLEHNYIKNLDPLLQSNFEIIKISYYRNTSYFNSINLSIKSLSIYMDILNIDKLDFLKNVH